MRERNERINTISDYLRDSFDAKVVKLALDGGFTCPNRDGSKGTGGCLFCSEAGSGDMASSIAAAANLQSAMQSQAELLSDKWPNAEYLAYFQSHTNTYAPAAELREKFEAALSCELPGGKKVLGLAIATRPDCISEEVLGYLSELGKRTFLWVELGLQTASDKTAESINRCYPLCVYDDAMQRLDAHGIRIVTHLIFGLPGESREDMLSSVRHITKPLPSGRHIFGVKLHLLNVIKGSRLAEMQPGYEPFGSMEEYIDLVCCALRIIPRDVTVHRMTGDCPRRLLISPPWSYKKRSILNGINALMRELDAHQGDRL